jgi:hypothetical protein
MIYSYLIVLRPPGRFLYKKNGKLYNVLIPKNFFHKVYSERPSPNWGAFFLTKNNDSAIINHPDILFP